MPIEPLDFLNIAKSYPETSEIERRNTMSRAYYAAYHACNQRFKASNTHNGGMHEKLIQSSINSPDKNDRILGYLLRPLKGLRVKADYHIDVDIVVAERQDAITHAEKIIEKLNQIT